LCSVLLTKSDTYCLASLAMGKQTCADSARNANLTKALLKKKKINDESKENVSAHMNYS